MVTTLVKRLPTSALHDGASNTSIYYRVKNNSLRSPMCILNIRVMTNVTDVTTCDRRCLRYALHILYERAGRRALLPFSLVAIHPFEIIGRSCYNTWLTRITVTHRHICSLVVGVIVRRVRLRRQALPRTFFFSRPV